MRSDSHLPKALQGLRIPLIASPLFIISVPELVIAQCKAGIVGSFPALNAREGEGEHPLLDTWLTQIKEELDRHNQANPDTPAAPYAVNQIVHRSNTRLDRDLEICAKHDVPIWITSLGARVEVNEADKAAFVAASGPVYDEFAETVPGGAEMIKTVLDLANAQ